MEAFKEISQTPFAVHFNNEEDELSKINQIVDEAVEEANKELRLIPSDLSEFLKQEKIFWEEELKKLMNSVYTEDIDILDGTQLPSPKTIRDIERIYRKLIILHNNGFKLSFKTYVYIVFFYLLTGRYEDGVELLTQLLQEYDSPLLKHYLALTYFHQGELESAVELFHQASLPASLFSIGLIYYKLENYNEAVKYLEKVPSNYPKYKDVLIVLGHSYYALGDKLKAVQYYEKYLRNSLSKDRKIIRRTADIFYEIGQYSKALHYYRQLDDLSDEVIYRMAICYYFLGLTNKAISVIANNLVHSIPEDSRPIDYFWALLEVGKYDLNLIVILIKLAVEERDERLKELVERVLEDLNEITNPELLNILAETLLSMGNYRKALMVAKKASEVAPDNAMALKLLAKSYIKLGFGEETIPIVNKLISMDEIDEEIFLYAASYLLDLDKAEKAVEILSKLEEKEMESDTLYVLLGRAYTYLGNYDKAIEYLRSAYELVEQPYKKHVVSSLAYCYYKVEDYQRSIRLYKEAISLDPSNKELYSQLAEVYKKVLDQLDPEVAVKTIAL